MRTIPENLILPSFGGSPAKAADAGTETATSGGGGGYSGPRKLELICSKGNLDMAYPGLILGNAALGEGVETHMFFTFWGFDMITKSRMHDLKFTPVGNTATHMPMGITPFPGVTGMATHQLKKSIADLGV